MLAAEYLTTVYSAVPGAEEFPRHDVAFNLLADLLLEGKFSVVEEILATIDLGRLDSTTVFAIVCVSNWAKDRLLRRPAFCDRAEERLVALCGKEAARDLMVNMRGTEMESGLAWSLDMLSPWLGEIPK